MSPAVPVPAEDPWKRGGSWASVAPTGTGMGGRKEVAISEWADAIYGIATLAGDVLKSAAAIVGDVARSALAPLLGPEPTRPAGPPLRTSSATNVPAGTLRSVESQHPVAATKPAPDRIATPVAMPRHEHAPALPAEDRLLVLARGPGEVFAYWTLAAENQERLAAQLRSDRQAAAALRVRIDTGESTLEERLLTVPAGVQHVHLELPPMATSVRITFGCRTPSGFVGLTAERYTPLPVHSVSGTTRQIRRWIDRRTGTEATAPSAPPPAAASAALLAEQEAILTLLERSSAPSSAPPFASA